MTTNRSTGAIWAALAALVAAFALSHAFRTVVTLVALPLRDELGLRGDAIGIVGGAFHLAFGIMQLPVGIMLDQYGPRRTVLVAFPAAIVGAAITAMAEGVPTLLVGQWLVGIGCAPCFLATLILISRSRPPAEFSRLSGIVLGIGSAGMLLTGTPLAWVVENVSWRAAFWLLAAVSAAAWAWAWAVVPGEPAEARRERPRHAAALLEVRHILLNRHMLGMIALGSVTYASFISLRGLWLVPLMSGRHGYSLVESGHVALLGSIMALLGPLIAGRLDPGGPGRRVLIAGCTLAYVAMFVVLALGTTPLGDAGLTLVLAIVSGYMLLHYSEVREIWPPEMSGRALAIFNSAMFLGVALMQWASGTAAAAADSPGADPVAAPFWTMAAMLLVGTALYLLLRPLSRGGSGPAGARAGDSQS